MRQRSFCCECAINQSKIHFHLVSKEVQAVNRGLRDQLWVYLNRWCLIILGKHLLKGERWLLLLGEQLLCHRLLIGILVLKQ